MFFQVLIPNLFVLTYSKTYEDPKIYILIEFIVWNEVSTVRVSTVDR